MLDAAVATLRREPGVESVALSPVYETEPVGPAGQGRYLNAAAVVETVLSPRGLLEAMLRIESELGRVPRENRQHWGPRPIDLDLLLYGDAVLEEPGLCVPHLRMHERWFVMRPLADLVPAVQHPTLEITLAELAERLEPQGVRFDPEGDQPESAS